MKNKFYIRYWEEELKTMLFFPADKNMEPMLGCEVNGTLVFENDLIESISDSDGERIVCKILIVFENGAFWADESFKKDGSYLTLLSEWNGEIKVIGNIFEP